jgi:DNA-binding MarR family transcriptional regulator
MAGAGEDRDSKGPAGAAASAEADVLQLDRYLPYRLSVLTLAVSRTLARLYSERFGLTVPEWRAMAVLGHEQPLSANDICARTNMDKVQVSRAIARLFKAGLVIRHTDPGDRRRAVLWLSPRGLAAYGEIVPKARALEEELLKVLTSKERAQFDRLLDKLTARARDLQEHF